MKLTEEQIQEFHENGVLVIPSVLSQEEIALARQGFREMLLKYDVDTENLIETGQNLKKLSSTNGAGGILDLFYFEWKLKLNEHPLILSIYEQLWSETYAKNSGLYAHPYGEFDPTKSYMYIDRVCYRVPDSISEAFNEKKSKKRGNLQRSLTPHLDCCPHHMYQNCNKWRPIQAFIPLTDTLLPNQGGFEACKGLHKEFESWASNRKPSEGFVPTEGSKDNGIPCVGQFTPIRPKEDRDILERFESISCKAGDMVCWDFRIPHANSLHNHTDQAREVLYLGYLPYINLNKDYCEKQLIKYRSGQLPVDQWHSSSLTQECHYEFTELGKKMMTILPWEE